MATVSHPSFSRPSVEHYPPKEVTPLADASASGDFDTIKRILGSYLAEQSPKNHALQEFWPVLLTALAYDRADIASYLLDVGIPLASVHVQQAIETKSAANVLLRHGWNIKEPLSDTQHPPLAFVIEDWDITNWFLDHDANPNAACRLDLTPMSFAVQRSPLQTIHLIFDRGGDIKRGQLLHHAIERDNNVIQVLQLLLQRGTS